MRLTDRIPNLHSSRDGLKSLVLTRLDPLLRSSFERLNHQPGELSHQSRFNSFSQLLPLTLFELDNLFQNRYNQSRFSGFFDASDRTKEESFRSEIGPSEDMSEKVGVDFEFERNLLLGLLLFDFLSFEKGLVDGGEVGSVHDEFGTRGEEDEEVF